MAATIYELSLGQTLYKISNKYRSYRPGEDTWEVKAYTISEIKDTLVYKSDTPSIEREVRLSGYGPVLPYSFRNTIFISKEKANRVNKHNFEKAKRDYNKQLAKEELSKRREANFNEYMRPYLEQYLIGKEVQVKYDTDKFGPAIIKEVVYNADTDKIFFRSDLYPANLYSLTKENVNWFFNTEYQKQKIKVETIKSEIDVLKDKLNKRQEALDRIENLLSKLGMSLDLKYNEYKHFLKHRRKQSEIKVD